MSGNIAKNKYKYQDWCNLYCLLYFYNNCSKFEKVICENEKIDFEIHGSDYFYAYQVKGGEIQPSAKYLNDLFKSYSSRTNDLNKNQNKLYLIMQKYPENHYCSYLSI